MEIDLNKYFMCNQYLIYRIHSSGFRMSQSYMIHCDFLNKLVTFKLSRFRN